MFIHDFLEYYARNNSDAPCVSQGGLTLSYADVDGGSNQLANGLLKLGVGKGERVAVLGENSPAHFLLFMAVAKIGAVAVPLNYRLAAAELAFIINDAEVKVLIVLEGLEQTLQALKPQLSSDVTILVRGVDGDQDLDRWLGSQSAAKPVLPVSDTDAFIQLYTSGTTGNPKGVVCSHRNAVSLVIMNNASTPVRPSAGMEGIICAPLFHIGGAGSVFMGLYTGQHTLLHQMFDPNKLVADIENHTVTAVFMVPAMIAAVLQMPDIEKRDFSKLQQIFYGASPISETLLRRALEVFQCEFVQMYGMTETTGSIITLSAEDHRRALAGDVGLLRSAGRASAGAEAKIISPSGDQLELGEVGEICVKSPTNMLEYFNLPDATRETLQDGWVRTGDAGYMDAQGYIYLKDRIKDMVVSGGENIYPVEVENAIAKHAAVVDVAVIGVPDEKFGEALLAFVVLTADQKLSCDDLVEFCRDKIAGYKIPRQLELIDELPRNASGKILKKILRAPFWKDQDRNVG